MKEKIMSFMNDKVAPLSQKLAQQRHMQVLQRSFVMLIPLTLVGSIFLILSTPPVTAMTTNGFLLAWKSFAQANMWLKVPYDLTLGMLGMWVCLFVSYTYAVQQKLNAVSGVAVALISFLVICGQPATSELGSVMPMGFLGAQGIFTAMLVGLLSIEIMAFIKRKNLNIKLPASLPPNILAPFETVIPMLVSMVICMGANMALLSFTGKNVPQLIAILFTPLVVSSDSLWGLLVLMLLVRTLWFFGIHPYALMGVIMPIWMANTVTNAEAYASGTPLPYIVTFATTSITYGALFPCALAMMMRGKSQRMKTVAKAGIIPAFMGIGEPIMFGAPTVLNPILFIPNLIQTVIECVVAYGAIALGIVGRTFVQGPEASPLIFRAFLSNMEITSAFIWIAVTIVSTLIFLPFVKVQDDMYLKEEKEAK